MTLDLMLQIGITETETDESCSNETTRLEPDHFMLIKSLFKIISQSVCGDLLFYSIYLNQHFESRSYIHNSKEFYSSLRLKKLVYVNAECGSGKKQLGYPQVIKMEAIAYCNSIAKGEYFTKFEYLTKERFTNEDHLNSLPPN